MHVSSVTMGKRPTHRALLVGGATALALLSALKTYLGAQKAGHASIESNVAPAAAAVASALERWTSGDLPLHLIRALGVASGRDAADAVIAAAAAERPRSSGTRSGVVDVGANKGFPVTKLGLERGVGFLLSVEPDARNFRVLESLKNEHGLNYIPVKGAAGREKKTQRMSFSKDRDDHTCFGCLDMENPGVYTEEVLVHTVDALLSDAGLRGRRVALLKTDTQGYEAAVLTGAARSLREHTIENVIMEYDAKLFHSRAGARTALDILFRAGMQCAPLAFAGIEPGASVPLFDGPVSPDTADAFWDFVVSQGGPYTDLFCSRRE